MSSRPGTAAGIETTERKKDVKETDLDDDFGFDDEDEGSEEDYEKEEEVEDCDYLETVVR